MLKTQKMRNGKLGFDARSLYQLFGLRTDFSTWMQLRIKRSGLIKNVHYEETPRNEKLSGRPRKDYVVSIHTAIGLAFRENNPGGRKFLQDISICEIDESAPAPQPPVLTPPGLGTPYAGAPPVTLPGGHNA